MSTNPDQERPEPVVEDRPAGDSSPSIDNAADDVAAAIEREQRIAGGEVQEQPDAAPEATKDGPRPDAY